MREETSIIHKGLAVDKQYSSVSPPVYMTSTFALEEPGPTNESGYFYTRKANPSRNALEMVLASLEQGTDAIATSSGMSAISMVAFLLEAGDHLIADKQLYGGTYSLFQKMLTKFNVEVSFIEDINDSEALSAHIKPNTKMIWIETPSNPLFKITDIQSVSKLAKSLNPNIIICADNTFMTPLYQKPLTLGADIVIHSTSKYINGHSDIIGGAIITNNTDLAEQLRFNCDTIGTAESPFDSWLVHRGVRTMVPRMKAHQDNALQIAQYLEKHNLVQSVFYPGLESHPQHTLIKQQMTGFGGILSVMLDTQEVNPIKFLQNLNLFNLAVSVGGVESLSCHPWSMSHWSMDPIDKEKAGISQSLIRLSVGIENIQDLIDDIDNAFSKSLVSNGISANSLK